MIEGLGRGSRNILVGKRSAVHCLQKVSHDVRHVVPFRALSSQCDSESRVGYNIKL